GSGATAGGPRECLSVDQLVQKIPQLLALRGTQPCARGALMERSALAQLGQHRVTLRREIERIATAFVAGALTSDKSAGDRSRHLNADRGAFESDQPGQLRLAHAGPGGQQR